MVNSIFFHFKKKHCALTLSPLRTFPHRITSLTLSEILVSVGPQVSRITRTPPRPPRDMRG